MPDNAHPVSDELILAFERATPVRSVSDANRASRLGDRFDFDSVQDGHADAHREGADSPDSAGGARQLPLGDDEDQVHRAAKDPIGDDRDETASEPPRKRSSFLSLLLVPFGLAIVVAMASYLPPRVSGRLPHLKLLVEALLPSSIAGAGHVDQPPPLPKSAALQPSATFGAASTPPAANQPPASPPPMPLTVHDVELLEHRIEELATEISVLNATVSSVRGEMGQARQEVADRISQLDGNLSQFDTHFLAVDQAESGLEQRLAAFAERGRPGGPLLGHLLADGQVGSRAARQPSALAKQKGPSQPSDAPQRILTGYSLRGVSRNAALVQTPSGLVRIEMGGTAPGLGIAQSVWRDGYNWVLVTSVGIVRE